jgi:hypothetical protein
MRVYGDFVRVPKTGETYDVVYHDGKGGRVFEGRQYIYFVGPTFDNAVTVVANGVDGAVSLGTHRNKGCHITATTTLWWRTYHEINDNVIVTDDFNQEETEMNCKARIYEYRVHNDDKILASGEVVVPGDACDPQNTARDLAVQDFVKNNADVSITDVNVVVRPFSNR